MSNGKLKVFDECCQNCLFTPERIVSISRMKEIVQKTVKEQSYFICHKASMKDETVVCKNFYDRLGQYSNLIRIMERVGGIEFVPQQDQERLMPYSEMKPRKKKQTS